jgi:hypothetical protein
VRLRARLAPILLLLAPHGYAAPTDLVPSRPGTVADNSATNPTSDSDEDSERRMAQWLTLPEPQRKRLLTNLFHQIPEKQSIPGGQVHRHPLPGAQSPLNGQMLLQIVSRDPSRDVRTTAILIAEKLVNGSWAPSSETPKRALPPPRTSRLEPEFFRAFIAGATDPDPSVREAAVKAEYGIVARLDPPQGVALLNTWIADDRYKQERLEIISNAIVQDQALWAFGYRGGTRMVRPASDGPLHHAVLELARIQPRPSPRIATSR